MKNSPNQITGVDDTTGLDGIVEKHGSSIDGKNNKEKKPETKKELGGPKGLEPTRYGDWESKGRCYDF